MPPSTTAPKRKNSRRNTSLSKFPGLKAKAIEGLKLRSRTPGFKKALEDALTLKPGASFTMTYPKTVEKGDRPRLYFRQQLSARLRVILADAGFKNLTVSEGERASQFTVTNRTHVG